MAQAYATRGARRSPWVVAAAIGVLVALVGAFATQFRSASSPHDGTTTNHASTLPGVAGELQRLLALDQNATFHATYEVSSSDLPGAAVTFETWRRPPRTRSDITVRKTDGVVRTRQIQMPDQTIACQAADTTPWKCTSVPPDAGAASDPFGSAIATELAKATSVTVRNRNINGHRARCFTITKDSQSALYCAAADGVPLRVESPGATLQIRSLDHAVGDVFDPPADVQ